MRSKSLFAAIALAIVCSWSAARARPADPKGKAAADKNAADKKKAAELHADDKSMKKQFNWEDKVMGPDDKRAELEKIARAHAINEKAEKEKERQAALAPAPAPAPAPAKAKKNEVSLPSTAPAEKPSDTPHEISPKLASEAAKAPPPPVTKGDDKFIDKLLKEERVSSRKKTSASDDEIKGLLAGVKTGKGKKGDSVDNLLRSAEKGPAMPAPRAAAALPDWTKTPDIAPSTPAHAPIAAKAPAKKNDGVIQVVQGAAPFTPPASFAPPPAPPPPVATRTTTSRKTASRTVPAKAVDWNDPFAEGSSTTKTVATRDRDRSERFTPAASVSRKEPSASRPTASTTGGAGWSDPFADAPETRKATRRTVTAPAPAAPASAPKREKIEPAAHPPGWKDPFTKVSTEPPRTAVAMRELGKNESSKWEIASHRGSGRATSSDSHAAGGWAVLKKRR